MVLSSWPFGCLEGPGGPPGPPAEPPLRSDLNPRLPHPLPSLHFWGWPFQLWKLPKSISLKHSKG